LLWFCAQHMAKLSSGFAAFFRILSVLVTGQRCRCFMIMGSFSQIGPKVPMIMVVARNASI
jgi:hypothetical protein